MLGVIEVMERCRELKRRRNALQLVEGCREPERIDLWNVARHIAGRESVRRNHAALQGLELDGLDMIGGRYGRGSRLIEIVDVFGPARFEIEATAACAAYAQSTEEHGVVGS